QLSPTPTPPPRRRTPYIISPHTDTPHSPRPLILGPRPQPSPTPETSPAGKGCLPPSPAAGIGHGRAEGAVFSSWPLGRGGANLCQERLDHCRPLMDDGGEAPETHHRGPPATGTLGMIDVGSFRSPTVQGVSPRAVLRARGAAASALGAAGCRAGTAAEAPKARSVLLVWLGGGPSHLDLFDPKPDAPAEYRGPFATIATRTPGVRFTELLPKLAAR